MWPLACWNVHAMERLRRLNKEHTVPGFGAKVLVRKRFWKSRELEPTHETVEYIATLPEVHGHLVRRADGALMITSYVLQRTEQPPELADTWLAIQTVAENKEDAMEIRRRIRGKTSVRTLQAGEDQGDHLVRLKSITETVENEGITMLDDDEETAKVVYKLLRVLAKELKNESEDEEVLRTKVVPISQFLREHEMWKPAVLAEMNQLFEEKGALRRTTMAELQDLRAKNFEVELIPSKLVITMKPGPKRKVRIVACGNYVESKGEELFAAGADSTALRLALKLTAQLKWTLYTVDIRVAFLNAPLTTTLKDGSEDKAIFALKPPALLVKLNFAEKDEVWVAERAIYGLRQSPRSWSLHRDETLRGLQLPGYTLRQAVSEPNLWIVEGEGQRLCGLILVYVDDMMITGETGVAKMIIAEIQKIWQTSEPEGIDEGRPTKFLGMEIEKVGENIKASQTSFIKDRLNVNLGERWMDVKGSTTPCSRDIGEVEDEDNVTTELVREAQRVVGELLWLVTRTRVDLMYVTSRLSQLVLRAPREVARVSKQVWSYLKRTAAQGLLFTPDAGEGWAGECEVGLQAYSDASFAPEGGHSIGAVITKWNGSPMMWRAGKQPFPTLSAAEAELTEATEAMLMGDAFDALLTDLFEEYPRSLMVDNMAAIHLITEESGAWRTRHLRLRANHLRWRFSRLDWRALHCPGAIMAADLGTKPLSAGRMDDLKVICGMSTEVENETVNGRAIMPDEEKIKKALKIVASLVQVVKSQGDGGEERPHARREDDAVMWMMIAAYTFLVVIAVTVFQRAFGVWKQYTDDLAEGQREDMTATPEQRRRIRQAHILLDEAERQRNYAEEQLFRAVADVYRPRTISGLGSSRRTSLESRRSSGRRSREEFEDQETERRGGRSSSARRDFSEEYTKGPRMVLRSRENTYHLEVVRKREDEGSTPLSR